MIRILFAILAALLSTATAAERPNILLVLSDDHSIPHLGAYGCPNCESLDLTPNLDRFASEGMRFDRAYTSAPQCAPSRVSIFTGQSPIAVRATRFAQPAPAHTPLFTDLLRDAGYWVGLDGRHQHLDGRGNDLPHISEALEEDGMRGPEFESRFDHFVRGASTKGESLPRIGEMFGDILDIIPDDRPWFLYFGFNQPHRKFGLDHEGIDPDKLVLPPDWPDLPEVRVDYARYLSEVSDLDTGFGAVTKVLEERQLDESTLVLFMGDNGDALLRGKGTLHTRGLHVPLIARWPGKIESGSHSTQLVSGIDIATTILASAGVDKTDRMLGRNFLDPSTPPREFIYGERGWHFGPLTQTDGFDLSRSVTTERYHFIYNALPDRPYYAPGIVKDSVWNAIAEAGETGKLSSEHQRMYNHTPRPVFELYDLEIDPYNRTNKSGDPSLQEIETNLRMQLDRWMIREGDYLPLPGNIHAIDEKAKEQKAKGVQN